MAFGDEIEMTDLINEALQTFFMGQDPEAVDDNSDGDLAFVTFLIETVKANFKRIMEMAAADETDIDALLRDMDNYQVTEVATMIVDQNFLGDVSKNLKSLFKSLKSELGLERLLQPSASGTDIGSTTSTESPLNEAG
jgi:uncharacterized protein with ATP-grasp and redox domains